MLRRDIRDLLEDSFRMDVTICMANEWNEIHLAADVVIIEWR